eukprot:TRINITY_DN52478_c0_g1_i1.p1 TRINITY_DN52478_c0_g1~~TRINITY_DN52478_c0_g1_i1.p1  ORF type:complete len:152 (-),score=29.41 TRINITY_DN52478_c0_g1_i1:55-510(-)
MQRGLVGSEMCIRDSINAEYMGKIKMSKMQISIHDITEMAQYERMVAQTLTQTCSKRCIFSYDKTTISPTEENCLKRCVLKHTQVNRIVHSILINKSPIVQLRRKFKHQNGSSLTTCLLYTSDAADDTPCVDLGGRRIIKKKKNEQKTCTT